MQHQQWQGPPALNGAAAAAAAPWALSRGGGLSQHCTAAAGLRSSSSLWQLCSAAHHKPVAALQRGTPRRCSWQAFAAASRSACPCAPPPCLPRPATLPADPLGLGVDSDRLKWYAEAEKTNGRWAMAAVRGGGVARGRGGPPPCGAAAAAGRRRSRVCTARLPARGWCILPS